MRDTITFTGELSIEVCWCGITHAVPKQMVDRMRRQRDNGETQTAAYCPLGHTWILPGESKVEIERRRAENLRAQLTHTRDQLQAEKRSHSATRGQLTKTKKRAAASVCPVDGCQRSFVQMERHLRSQHPEFVHARDGH